MTGGSRIRLNVLVAVAVLACCGALHAQCVINPNPTFYQNDGGCPVAGATDPNGGCNANPVSFQTTGSLSSTSPSFTIGGTTGADAAVGARDIDWYSFTVAETCFVKISVAMTNPTGTPSQNIQVYSGRFNADGSPLCESVYGYSFSSCEASFPEFFAEPGTYMCIVTTSLTSSGGVSCNSPYTATISARFSAFASCGSPTSGNCGVVTPSVSGCQDISCCDRLCTANPFCCDVEWDASCATAARQPTYYGGCGVFVYDCPQSGPPNDCATAAEVVSLAVATPFDNARATTDGPNTGQCSAPMRKDVWFAVRATGSGRMTCVCAAKTQDVVLSVHDFGASGPPFDGAGLDENFVGCLDYAGIGGESMTIDGAIAGHWYLWRVGQWDVPPNAGTAGAGTVEITLEQSMYDSGVHAPVCSLTGTPTNLGLSSGAISYTNTQRWLAAPISVPTVSGSATAWRTTRFMPEGFQMSGTINEKLNWILWRRTGSTAPNYNTDQIASGQVPYPTLGANGEADIPVDIILEPGDYYFTVFASATGNPCRPNDGQTVISNFAWFIGAPNGIAFPDPDNPGGYFQWRASVLPGAGPASEVVVAGTTTPCDNTSASPVFPKYTFLNAFYQNCTPGGSMRPVYSPSLHIFGEPDCVDPADPDGDGVASCVDNCPGIANSLQADCDGDGLGDVCEVASGASDVNQNGVPDECECIADLDHNGSVDSVDLAVLLSKWATNGGPDYPQADINRSGFVDAADLTLLFNEWGGSCP